jgi:hypothetical protein
MAATVDLFVFLTGVDEDRAAQPLPADEFKQQWASRAGFRVVQKGWFGSIKKRGAVVSAALQDIVSTPGFEFGNSKLVIFGYSAGGWNALDLCRQLEVRPDVGQNLVVDLLVTVDAAGKGENDKIDRHVARCVAANVNFYQTHRTWAGSVGGPNVPLGELTDVTNVKVGRVRDQKGNAVDADHANMEDGCWSFAAKEIADCFSDVGDYRRRQPVSFERGP